MVGPMDDHEGGGGGGRGEGGKVVRNNITGSRQHDIQNGERLFVLFVLFARAVGALWTGRDLTKSASCWYSFFGEHEKLKEQKSLCLTCF